MKEELRAALSDVGNAISKFHALCIVEAKLDDTNAVHYYAAGAVLMGANLMAINEISVTGGK